MKRDTVDIVAEIQRLLEEQNAALRQKLTEDGAVLCSLRAELIKHLAEQLRDDG